MLCIQADVDYALNKQNRHQLFRKWCAVE